MSLSDERRQVLSEAHRARNAGHERRAISLYKRLLREEPRNVEISLRVAPLLARRGDAFEAWQLYRAAARHLAHYRQYKDCLSVYREACRYVPREYDAWRLRAELELKLGRDDAAFETLLDGRTQFGDIHTRSQAIALLVRARTIAPWDAEVVLDLARLYSRTDQTDAALELLTALATRCDPETGRHARSLQWRITLSPRFAWLWVQSWRHRWLGEPTSRPLDDPAPARVDGH